MHWLAHRIANNSDEKIILCYNEGTKKIVKSLKCIQNHLFL